MTGEIGRLQIITELPYSYAQNIVIKLRKVSIADCEGFLLSSIWVVNLEANLYFWKDTNDIYYLVRFIPDGIYISS